MDLVTNFVGTISPSIFGDKNNQGVTPNVDLEDKTFSDMLERQMQKEIEQNKTNILSNLNFPNGINIADFDSNIPQFTVNTENKLESVKPVNEFEKSTLPDDFSKKEMSTAEVLTFFNSLFDNKPTLTDTTRNGLFDFERKIAANLYGKYSKNIALDLGEFVADTIRKH